MVFFRSRINMTLPLWLVLAAGAVSRQTLQGVGVGRVQHPVAETVLSDAITNSLQVNGNRARGLLAVVHAVTVVALLQALGGQDAADILKAQFQGTGEIQRILTINVIVLIGDCVVEHLEHIRVGEIQLVEGGLDGTAGQIDQATVLGWIVLIVFWLFEFKGVRVLSVDGQVEGAELGEDLLYTLVPTVCKFVVPKKIVIWRREREYSEMRTLLVIPVK